MRPDIRGPKPLIPIESWWWLAAALAGVAALVVAWWWWRRRRAAQPAAPAAPPDPPHIAALKALDRLDRDDLPARGRFDDYYVALSSIVRRYIEAQFGLRAPEMTTDEFLLAASQSIAPEHRQLLRQFLSHCDLVKFAKYQPSIDEARRAMTAAREFIAGNR